MMDPHLWVWTRMATASLLFSWNRRSLCGPGWPQAQIPPASVSQMLRLQANDTTPGYCVYKERRRSWSHTRPLCLLSDVTLISVTIVSVSGQKNKKTKEAWGELCECPNYVEVRCVCVYSVCCMSVYYMCVCCICVYCMCSVCCICVFCIVWCMYMCVPYVCVVCVCEWISM